MWKRDGPAHSWNCLLSALTSRAEAPILAYITLTWPIKIGAAFSADRRLSVLVTFKASDIFTLNPLLASLLPCFTVIFISLYRHISPQFFISSLRLNIGSTASTYPHTGLQVSVSDRKITFTEWQAGPSDPVKSCEGSVPTQRVLKRAMSGQE